MAKPFYGDLEFKGQQTVRWADADSSNIVSLGAPATVTADLALTLPATTTNNGAITSDGSGNLSIGLLTNDNIDAAAAIAQSKLSLDITNAEVNASAAIAESKLALDQNTADLAQRALSNLTVASLAAESLLVGSSGTAVSALGVGTEGQVLKVVSGAVAWATDAGSASHAEDWDTADTATFAITHNLGTQDVIVQVYDRSTFESIEIDSVVRTNTNTVTVTASQAPPAGGWRVLISGV